MEPVQQSKDLEGDAQNETVFPPHIQEVKSNAVSSRVFHLVFGKD